MTSACPFGNPFLHFHIPEAVRLRGLQAADVVIRISEVLIFLRWLQYLVHEIGFHRTHVLINMDETSLSSCRDMGKGMACRNRHRRVRKPRRARDETDRSFVATTYMAAVCDCALLQPLLPQIILAKYSQNQRPPAHLEAEYRSLGFPFEFWHGSVGRVTPRLFRQFCTRLRQAVGSFNADAWIVLVIDCSTCHLDLLSVHHMRRRGILAVFVPAKLTWLLQLLDVFCFKALKTDFREAQARSRLRDSTGQIRRGQWMTMATSVIRRQVINVDWSGCWARMGGGESCDNLTSDVARHVRNTPIHPALPTLREFATLIGRPATTDTTRRLHASLVGHALAVRRMPPDARPPRTAAYHLPHARPASARTSRRVLSEGANFSDVSQRVLQVVEDQPVFHHEFGDARNWHATAAGPHAD